eukprot:5210684-Amphidinium_carterae.2
MRRDVALLGRVTPDCLDPTAVEFEHPAVERQPGLQGCRKWQAPEWLVLLATQVDAPTVVASAHSVPQVRRAGPAQLHAMDFEARRVPGPAQNLVVAVAADQEFLMCLRCGSYTHK